MRTVGDGTNTEPMNLNNFTIKSQEAIQQAQQLAMSNGQQVIEIGHVLKGILSVDENVTPFLLKKLNVNIEVLTQVLDRIVDGYPKVEGGNVYFSQSGTRVLQIGRAHV